MITNLAKIITEKNIEEELKKAYLSYATDIIINRALPDIRDGLKPVHRKILYAMFKLHNTWDKQFKKSARIVGDVIGKYHPHGENAVYDTIVRLAQSFTMRYKLIEGQGNFGSIDGDPAAAMRYTEIKMTKITNLLLDELGKKTVNFTNNYDSTEKLPEVLPTKIPNILLNGTSGIAVGFTTNIPPHNINDVINATIKLLDNENIHINELIKIIQGPDFPTAGIICGTNGIYNAYKTGKGKIEIKSKILINETTLIITELPYQINKLHVIKKIISLIKEKKLTGITNITDESDKDGIRIVINIIKNTDTNILLNKLFKYTQLKITYTINMTALVKNKPKTLNLKNILISFLDHRKNTILNKLNYEINEIKEKLHILEGLKIIHTNLNNIIDIIKTIDNKKDLRQYNIKKKLENKSIFLTNIQIESLLELQLHQLSKLEKKIIEENIEKNLNILQYNTIIFNNPNKLNDVIKQELTDIKNDFTDPRKTFIEEKTYQTQEEDLLSKKTLLLILTSQYRYRICDIDQFKPQYHKKKRKKITQLKKNETCVNSEILTPHSVVYFFSITGNFYKIKEHVYKEDLQNKYTTINETSKILYIVSITNTQLNDDHQKFILTITKNGMLKKIPLLLLKKTKKQGSSLIKLNKNDLVVDVKIIENTTSIVLITNTGKLIYYREATIKQTGKNTKGTKILKTTEIQKILCLIKIEKNDDYLILITKKGNCKFHKITDIKKKKQGTPTPSIKITNKENTIIGGASVKKIDELLLLTHKGFITKIKVTNILNKGKNTKGLKLLTLLKDDFLIKIQKIHN